MRLPQPMSKNHVNVEKAKTYIKRMRETCDWVNPCVATLVGGFCKTLGMDLCRIQIADVVNFCPYL